MNLTAVRSRPWCLSLALILAGGGAGSCRSPQTQWTENDGGMTRWIGVPPGRLKTRVYTGTAASESPVLVLVLHGDLPEPSPSVPVPVCEGHCRYCQERRRNWCAATRLSGSNGWPVIGGYGRCRGRQLHPRSRRRGGGWARKLAKDYRARKTILVGHSGGAAIAANLLGRQPDVAQGAVLVACGCDPRAWRATRWAETGNPIFNGPTRSLLPLDLAPDVAHGTIVRMVVGQDDDVVPPQHSRAYATALRDRGIDVSVEVLPGLGHNILFRAARHRCSSRRPHSAVAHGGARCQRRAPDSVRHDER